MQTVWELSHCLEIGVVWEPLVSTNRSGVGADRLGTVWTRLGTVWNLSHCLEIGVVWEPQVSTNHSGVGAGCLGTESLL